MYNSVQQIYEEICHAVGKDPGSNANGHCPAHEDKNASFEVKILDNGKIWFKCYAGCDKNQILDNLGLQWSSLFPDDCKPKVEKKKKQYVKSTLTLQQLADYCKLPVEKLKKFGLDEELDDFWGQYIRVHYWDIEGKEYSRIRMRLRLKPLDKGNPKYIFKPVKGKKNRCPLVYGEWFLKRARELGRLIFVEGESDCWTLWHHGYPAIGIMGASSVKGNLKPEHIEKIREIYVFCEPGDGGENFQRGFSQRLHELGYEGKCYRVSLPEHKDPSDLHKAVGDDFRRYFDQALELKKPLPLSAIKEKKDTKYGKQLTEMGNAERLVIQHGEDLLYCHDWKKWLVWDGVRWASDRIGMVKKKAKETVRTIYNEANGIEDEDRRKSILAWAYKSEQGKIINSMISLAEVEDGIPVMTEELDSNKYLIACRNGTVDLRTGELRESSRDDRITKCAAVEYLSGSDCPTFLKFLDQIFEGNQDLVDFIQRAIGYTLTGDVSERSLFILWGVGKNGKSTLLEVIQSMMGDYSMRTPTDTLMVQYGGGSGIPNDIARLKGARFVSASESEEGQRLAESKLKDLTGGETISARFMRGEFFDFLPEFKLWLSTNHKPVIRGTDNAIWDRIKLVPFGYRVPDEQMDKSLPNKLQKELPGIFQWAIQGCLEWQKNGLGVPDEVTEAVQTYRNDMDDLGIFLEDSCVIDDFLSVPNKDLFGKYRKWCENNAMKMMSQKRFSQRMIERGFDNKKERDGRIWIGIRLLTDFEEQEGLCDGLTDVTDCDGKSHLDRLKRAGENYTEKSVTTRHQSQPVTDSDLPGGLGGFYDDNN